MAFWAYILRCADGKFYTGHTDDLERRIGEHQAGRGCDFTSRRLPVEPAWSESFGSRIEALGAERIVGGWSRGKKEALIARNWPMVSHLAKPPKERNDRPVPQGFSTSLQTNGEVNSTAAAPRP
ncbi:MAG: GIY-YIG nuclease family protein [Pseudomonadota bacterium]